MTPINHPPIHPPNDRLDRPPSRSRALATTSSLPLDALPLLPPVASTRSAPFSIQAIAIQSAPVYPAQTCVPDERAPPAAERVHAWAHRSRIAGCVQISWDHDRVQWGAIANSENCRRNACFVGAGNLCDLRVLSAVSSWVMQCQYM